MSIRPFPSKPFGSQSRADASRLEAVLRAGKAHAETGIPLQEEIFSNADLAKEVILKIAFSNSDTVCEDVLSICSTSRGLKELCDADYFRLALSTMGITPAMGEEGIVPWGKDSWKTCFVQACSTLRHLILLTGETKLHFLQRGGFDIVAGAAPGILADAGEFPISDVVADARNNYWIHPNFGPISYWNTRHVETMDHLFGKEEDFDQPLYWDTSNVLSMESMFEGALRFDKPLMWKTGKVVNMESMFKETALFNQTLDWDTSNVENMRSMFKEASSFNKPLDWDTGNVENMESMFEGATRFNQDLEEWETSNVETMSRMFRGTAIGDLPSWYRGYTFYWS